MDEEERNVLKNYGNFSLWFAFAQNRVSILLIRYQSTRAATTIFTYIYFLRSLCISRSHSLARMHTHKRNAPGPKPHHFVHKSNPRFVRAPKYNIFAKHLLLFFASICPWCVWARERTRLRRCICCIVRRMPREINNCVQKFICDSVQYSTWINRKERVSCFVLCVRENVCVCFFHLFFFQFNRTLGHARFVYKKINTFEQFTNMSINRDAAAVVAAVTK